MTARHAWFLLVGVLWLVLLVLAVRECTQQ